MSDTEEDNYQMYGTLLEPYDEDAIPKKKAFSIEDQIATDEQGRRRFHGAFTGGFSAGFFNTVGSLEGWKPTEFKSSRSEKAEKKLQKPQDFMDDEDVGQFGIAPSVIRATNDYSGNAVKRKRIPDSEGPIPGVPVLHSLLQPAKDSVGIKLLKKMGWKLGQGVGPRLSKSEKRKINRENKSNSGKIYGCEIPDAFRQQITISSSEEEEDDDTESGLTFAPDDYDPFIYKPKDNSFGLGYSGLDKHSILSSHISLFDPPEFKILDHKNNKVSIAGQAFGVGAFEMEDEDIYARDDMSKYDFELESAKRKLKILPKKVEKAMEKILEGFVEGNNPVSVKKSFPPPVLPKNFIPKHGIRISRFEPLPQHHKMYNYDRSKTTGRHDLSALIRKRIINTSVVTITNEDSSKKELISTTFNVSEEKQTEILKENATKITKDLPKTSPGIFKPFLSNPDKQKRYEEYLSLLKTNKTDQFPELQPASMLNWEREREKTEFYQAARMFPPVSGLVFDRFVVASTQDDTQDPLKPVGRSIYHHGTQDMRDAAKKKMFGALTRNIEVWKPNKLLCKRFNVPEPEISETEMLLSKRKKNKFSVFDYYEAYQQNKPITEGPEFQKETVIDTEEKLEKETVEKEKEAEIIIISDDKSDSNSKVDIPETQIINYDLKNLENPPIIPSTSGLNIKIQEMTKLNESKLEEISLKRPEEMKRTKIKIPDPKIIIPTDPKEKKDLFKAIFLSSSEDEDEKEVPRVEEKRTEMKKILLEEENIVKPATKGIFSDLDWSKVNRSKPIIDQNKIQTQKKEDTEDIYGPKLPTKVPEKIINTWKPTFKKISSVKDKDSSSSSDEEWKEAGSSAEKSNKKSSKKHKKHKSKHKKHKSKHKKKKH